MEKKMLLLLFALFAMSTMSAGRLSEVVKDTEKYTTSTSSASLTASDLLTESEQMLDQPKTKFSKKLTREEYLQKKDNENDESLDQEDNENDESFDQEDNEDEDESGEKKKPEFFDRLISRGTSVGKLAFVIVGVKLLWNLQSLFSKDGVEELLDAQREKVKEDIQEGKNKLLESMNRGLGAKTEAGIEEINHGDDELAKLGLRMQRAEKIAAQVETILPKVDGIAGGLTKTTDLAGAFLLGLGCHESHLKTNNEYDQQKITTCLAQVLSKGKLGRSSSLSLEFGFNLPEHFKNPLPENNAAGDDDGVGDDDDADAGDDEAAGAGDNGARPRYPVDDLPCTIM